MATDAPLSPHADTQPDTLPANVNDSLSAYGQAIKNRSGFIEDDSPLRPRRMRMPLAALVVGALTIAALAGGIGYAVGAAMNTM